MTATSNCAAGQVEHGATYATLLLVVGGVVVASGVEPNLHIFGASICFLAAGMRGLRAVLQAILLRPEEKLDSMSCLAYMVPSSTVLMLVLCVILEPGSYGVLMGLPSSGLPMLLAISANCAAAFASNYLNMAVTKRTSALSIQVRTISSAAFRCRCTKLLPTLLVIAARVPMVDKLQDMQCALLWSPAEATFCCDVQVLGQCKGVISAIVSVLCFHNLVPVWGWVGYGVTVVGCLAYGRCKAHFKAVKPAKTEKDAADDKAHDTQQWLSQVREEHGPYPMVSNNLGESERMATRAFSDAVLTEQSRARMHANVQGMGQFGMGGEREALLAEPESLAALSDGSELSGGEEEARERYTRARHTGHDRHRPPAQPAPPKPSGAHTAKYVEVPSRAHDGQVVRLGKAHTLGSGVAPGSMRSMIGIPTPGQRSRDPSRSSAMGSPSASPDERSSVSSGTLRTSVLRHEPAADARLVPAS